ncbi:MAG: hypothetical protein K2I61_02540 [Muribaculaceae bacterium]|nr:hypothetical protein [Muribaculaceae bacterium]
MNKSILPVLAAGALFMLVSCDSRQKLSEDLQGVWAGTPEQLTNSGAARATMVRMMEFTSTGNAGEGNVTLTAYITVENTMPANDSIVTPLTISASGTATITGLYQAKDDDDMLLNLDASSLTVNVDPKGVELSYDVLSGQSGSHLASLRPAAAMLASQQIDHAARNVFFNLTEIEDIKINNNMLKCEMAHKDLTFRRQPAGVAVE